MLLLVRRSSSPIKLTATIYYNIIENGVNHQQPKPNTKVM